MVVGRGLVGLCGGRLVHRTGWQWDETTNKISCGATRMTAPRRACRWHGSLTDARRRVEVEDVLGEDGLARERLAELHRAVGRRARRRRAGPAAGAELDELSAAGRIAERDELFRGRDSLLHLVFGDVDDVVAGIDAAAGCPGGKGGSCLHAQQVLRVILHLHWPVIHIIPTADEYALILLFRAERG